MIRRSIPPRPSLSGHGQTIAATCLLAIFAAGCFNPNPSDGAFKCDAADSYLCPTGLQCDRQRGLCVHVVANDMALGPLGRGDGGSAPSRVPLCDQEVRAGHFANPQLLGISTAGDDAFISVSSDGTQLLFASTVSGNLVPTIATIGSDPHSVTGAKQLSVAGAPAGLSFLGGAFGKDGSLWIAGGQSGANPTSQLYVGTIAGSTLTLGMAHTPLVRCVTASGFFAHPTFVSFDPKGELLADAPLNGCSQLTYVVDGALDRDIGTFTAAIATPTMGAPTVTPSGLTLLAATLGAGGQIRVATRADTTTQFNGNDLLPQGKALGTGVRDQQLLVHPNCTVAYLVSQRSGGPGGLDLWTLDITP
jgi:hypothetical protein